MDEIYFTNLWYPDFVGMAYGVSGNNLLIAPYFDNRGKATYVYHKTAEWNPKFVKARFIEYGNDEYAFVCYQDPKISFTKFNFGLYRSSMQRTGNYSNARDQIKSGTIDLGIVFAKNIHDFSSYEPLGESIHITDCKILTESELEEHTLEKFAHRACRREGYEFKS